MTRRSEVERGAERAPLARSTCTGSAPSRARNCSRRARPGASGCCPACSSSSGLTTPIMAAVTPAILKMTAQPPARVVIKFPAPTTIDSYAQFMGNLAQLALLVVIITGAAQSPASGAAARPCLFPPSRSRVPRSVWSKAVADLVILLAASGPPDLAVVVVTIALFDAQHIVPVRRVGGPVAPWRRCSACLMLWLSAAFDNARPPPRLRPRPVRLHLRAQGLPGHPRVDACRDPGRQRALLKGKDMALGPAGDHRPPSRDRVPARAPPGRSGARSSRSSTKPPGSRSGGSRVRAVPGRPIPHPREPAAEPRRRPGPAASTHTGDFSTPGPRAPRGCRALRQHVQRLRVRVPVVVLPRRYDRQARRQLGRAGWRRTLPSCRLRQPRPRCTGGRSRFSSACPSVSPGSGMLPAEVGHGDQRVLIIPVRFWSTPPTRLLGGACSAQDPPRHPAAPRSAAHRCLRRGASARCSPAR